MGGVEDKIDANESSGRMQNVMLTMSKEADREEGGK